MCKPFIFNLSLTLIVKKIHLPLLMKRLFLSVAIVILSFELFAIVLKSDKNSIELSDSNGALLNVLKDGTSVAVASETSFVLRFIDKQGNYVVLDNTNFKTFKFEINLS